jgi:REP element-mobilizing transposase RayT
VMPNHIHLLLQITDCDNGPSGRPVPTNTKVSQFVGTFKRFCNREIGENIWQYRSYDHVIRGEKDYLKIWNYIDGNPSKWLEDCYYMD